jgi:hypothetical protein
MRPTLALLALAGCASGIDSVRRERDACRSDREYICETLYAGLLDKLRPQFTAPAESDTALHHQQVYDAVSHAMALAPRCASIDSRLGALYERDRAEPRLERTVQIGRAVLRSLDDARKAGWPLADQYALEGSR